MKTHITLSSDKPLIVAGPCAAESRGQILASIEQAKKRNIDFMRICLWKPRTKPGFEGIGETGIDLLIEAARAGINPGTEVLIPDQAKIVMDTVLSKVPSTKLLLWIGARNQNHYNQREIARVAARDKRVFLMLKNQPWVSEDHWEGIIGHALDGGIDENQLILCHRGFIPNGINPEGLSVRYLWKPERVGTAVMTGCDRDFGSISHVNHHGRYDGEELAMIRHGITSAADTAYLGDLKNWRNADKQDRFAVLVYSPDAVEGIGPLGYVKSNGFHAFHFGGEVKRRSLLAVFER